MMRAEAVNALSNPKVERPTTDLTREAKAISPVAFAEHGTLSLTVRSNGC